MIQRILQKRIHMFPFDLILVQRLEHVDNGAQVDDAN